MQAELPTQPDRPALNPTALPVADAARLLSAAGGQAVTPEQIRADIDAGAPTNGDGTINLVRYAAWLVKQASGCGLQASGRDRAVLSPEARSLKPEAGGPEGRHA